MDFQVNQAMNQYQMSTERTANLQAENKRLVEETTEQEKRLSLMDTQIKSMTSALSTERRQRQEASFQFDAERTVLLGGDPNATALSTTAAADAQEVQTLRRELQEVTEMCELLRAQAASAAAKPSREGGGDGDQDRDITTGGTTEKDQEQIRDLAQQVSVSPKSTF